MFISQPFWSSSVVAVAGTPAALSQLAKPASQV
jgi:hypothetical protein